LIELVRATGAHVGTIAHRMRSEDIAECRAFERTPKQALRMGLRNSSLALTAKIDGRPEAMMGLVPFSILDGIGTPWMLSTDEAYRQGRALLRIGPRIIARFFDSSQELRQVVSQSNVRAIRLLRAWGFTVGDETKMIGGVPFLDFWMERS
jgi:ribosomal protein S18 acetylase RimI-like enzyme